ncbi:carbohydrate porin [Endomicrobium proavitum]|uniref:Porin n=1 Tax=Endomicrobium proavitum TaxID=1408281 RepID=A0A0G3WKE4_9BACT|nr:carbohydrate porin [Endomicrobium proavitum]AKL98352.1 exported protein of unknown function [Endomicrobium proavitum]
MKRSIALIAAALLFGAGQLFAATVEEEVAQLKKEVAGLQAGGSQSVTGALGIVTEVGGTFIFQGSPKINDGSDRSKFNGSYSLDLGFGKEFSSGALAYLHITAGIGDGLNNYLQTYGAVNADADNDGHLSISELWYEQSFFDKKLTATFGKLNPAGYIDENEYANDETSQFLNSSFVNSAVLDFADNNVGFRATYSPADLIDVTYAYIATSDEVENFDSNGFNAVQINVKPVENGNYRIYAWLNNTKNLYGYKKIEDNGGLGAATENDIKAQKGYGFGFSADQKVSESFGVFARAGFKQSAAGEVEVDTTTSVIDSAEPSLSVAWSVGAQVSGSLWSRENDKAGIAVGQVYGSEDYKKYIDNNEKSGAQTQGELYYSFALSENFAITPSVQYFLNPAGGNTVDANGDEIKNAVVYGLRAQINF